MSTWTRACLYVCHCVYSVKCPLFRRGSGQRVKAALVSTFLCSRASAEEDEQLVLLYWAMSDVEESACKHVRLVSRNRIFQWQQLNCGILPALSVLNSQWASSYLYKIMIWSLYFALLFSFGSQCMAKNKLKWSFTSAAGIERGLSMLSLFLTDMLCLFQTPWHL